MVMLSEHPMSSEVNCYYCYLIDNLLTL